MFLEDAQIHLPYSCDAITRSWSVHGFAHQGACLFVGDTLASPSSLFQIDHHADHAQPESGSRVGNLAHGAFSSAVSGNVRILEEIRQFGTISYPLPEAYKLKIATIPHVVAVAPLVIYGGIYHEASDQFPSVATEAKEIDMWSDWGLTGVDEFKKIKTACLVAQGTMRRFNLHVGQQIQLRGTLYPFNVTLNIVGTIPRAPAPNLLIFRLDYFEEAAGNPGIAHEFWVKVDDSRVVPEVCAALDNQFANSSAETRSLSEAAAIGSILGRYRIFMKLAEFLGLVAVVAIGLVAANTAAMSIRERRSEIAVMRSIGFPSGVILSLLVGESLIVAL